jgi:hypothetical protein
MYFRLPTDPVQVLGLLESLYGLEFVDGLFYVWAIRRIAHAFGWDIHAS